MFSRLKGKISDVRIVPSLPTALHAFLQEVIRNQLVSPQTSDHVAQLSDREGLMSTGSISSILSRPDTRQSSQLEPRTTCAEQSAAGTADTSASLGDL